MLSLTALLFVIMFLTLEKNEGVRHPPGLPEVGQASAPFQFKWSSMSSCMIHYRVMIMFVLFVDIKCIVHETQGMQVKLYGNNI